MLRNNVNVTASLSIQLEIDLIMQTDLVLKNTKRNLTHIDRLAHNNMFVWYVIYMMTIGVKRYVSNSSCKDLFFTECRFFICLVF